MRVAFLFLLFSLVLPCFAQSPADLYTLVVPGTVQMKYDLLLDQHTVEKPELVNKLLRLYKFKELGSSLNLSSGTGVVVSADGKIVTNSHVVTLSLEDVVRARSFLIDGFNTLLNRTETKKTFSQTEIGQLVRDLTKLIVQSPVALKVQVNNKETRAVRVLVQNPDLDLALVQSDFVGLVPLKLSDSSSLRVGEDVLALGYPLGTTLEEMFLEVTTTMTKGTVSALRSATLGIQHSASISHGNSGGPLITMKGEVVGINSAGITEANNLNLAIPSNIVKKFLRDSGFAAVADENSLLQERKTQEPPSGVKNPISGQGMIVIQGLTPGTQVTATGKEALTVPADGTLTLQNLAFGEVRIFADLPVYDKVYQPYYVYKEKSVLVNGYAPGLTLRFDDTKDFVVPASGVLDLPITFDKPHSLVPQPGWGRGFETTVLVTDETAYRITVPAGSLTVSGLPADAQLSLNGKPAGFPDQEGKWVGTFLPVGQYQLRLQANFLTSRLQKIDVAPNTMAQASLEAVPAGSLAVHLGQPEEDVSLSLLDLSGASIPIEAGQVQMLEPGVYRVQARRVGDEEAVFDRTATLMAGQAVEVKVPLLAWSVKHMAAEEAHRDDFKVRLGAALGLPHAGDFVLLAEWERWKAGAGVSLLGLALSGLSMNAEVTFVPLRLGSWDLGPGVTYWHIGLPGGSSSYNRSVDSVGIEVFIMEQGGFFATLGAAMGWESIKSSYDGRPKTETTQSVVPVVNIGWAWTVWH